MFQSGGLGWILVLVGVVLAVLALVVGGATWDLTIAVAVLGLGLVGVGALMVFRARRQNP